MDRHLYKQVQIEPILYHKEKTGIAMGTVAHSIKRGEYSSCSLNNQHLIMHTNVTYSL